jgi:hypothetical protein
LAGEVIPGRPVVVGNPIVTDTYTSDPAVIVHEGTAYLYTGHDEAPAGVDEYVMRDWLCFSSTDLRTWRSHGPLLAVDRFTWARGGAKAGAVVERDGRFFWYVAVDHATVPGGAIGVAVADNPLGPFRDALGAALITNDMPDDTGDDHTIDPSVIVHDGAAHLFWGKERCFSAPLDASMTALAGPITEIALPDFKEGAHSTSATAGSTSRTATSTPSGWPTRGVAAWTARGPSRASSTRCRATVRRTAPGSSSSQGSGSSSTTTGCCRAAAVIGARCAWTGSPTTRTAAWTGSA